MFKHDCTKHGHRFEARYSEVPSGYTMESPRMTIPELRSLAFYQTYIHDICTRCGEIKK